MGLPTKRNQLQLNAAPEFQSNYPNRPQIPLTDQVRSPNFTACEASPLVNVSLCSWGQRVRLLALERTAVWVLKFERTEWPRARGPPHDWGQLGRSRGSPAWATPATVGAKVHAIASARQGRRNRS